MSTAMTTVSVQTTKVTPLTTTVTASLPIVPPAGPKLVATSYI